MLTRSFTTRRTLGWFLLAAGLLIGVEAGIVQSPAFARRPDLLSGAILGDLALGLPLLYYWLLVRRLRWRRGAVVGVAGIGLLIAALLLPAAQRPLVLRVRYALAPLEILTVGYALWQLRVIRQHYRAQAAIRPDFLLNMTASLRNVLGAAGPLLAGEMALVRYSLLGWWGGPEVKTGDHAFSQHRTSGQAALVLVLLFVGLLETVGTHLLLTRWNPVVAWVLTAFSLYGLLFFVADLVAVVKRPLLLTADTLYLRAGLRWQIAVPRTQIHQLRRITEKPDKAPFSLNLTFLTAPNLLLELTESLEADGPYGLRRTVQQISFFADEPEELLQTCVA